MKTKPLVLSKYQPNYSSPKERARVEVVLAFCKPMLVEKKARHISSAALTKAFGNQTTRLSARLRHKLLQQEGTYAPGKHSFSYSLKRDGYFELAAAIGQTVQGDVEVARELYGGIASGAEVPEYSEPTPGSRRFTGVQNLPKALRAVLFKGWFDYDIEAAAPTLVYQSACKFHQWLYPGKVDMPYKAVAELVEDRAKVRRHIAEITGLDVATAKSIVVALFFGAKLVPHPKQAIYRLVGMDGSVLDRLKADPYVRTFRREVASMWETVLVAENVTNGLSTFKGGPVVKKLPKKSSRRSSIYFRLERQVIDVIEAILLADGIVQVLIHDGFMTRTRVDVKRLEAAVREKTGFQIRLAEAEVGAPKSSAAEVETASDDIFELIDGD